MLFKKVLTLVVFLLTVGTWLTTSSCSDDPKPEEPVTPSADGSEAMPPSSPGDGYSANTIYFAFDDYSLNAEARGELDRLAARLQGNPKAVVQIEGHCDERGSTEYNLALGERRAQSAKNYLVSQNIDSSRVTTISYGEEKPVASGHDESAWSKNRRGELNVTGN
jgi:peptidoglycan-associated lipoprotein